MTRPSPVQAARNDSQRGVAFALGAFVIWAVNPLFFKVLAHINPIEVIAHRIFWSVPVGFLIVMLLGRTSDITRVFKNPGLLGKMLLTGLLISVNWGVFVWAIGAGLTLETSLAYYINPLFNVLLGFAFLGERLSLAQTVAVGLAGIGVLIQAIDSGVFPWVAIILALAFSIYGYLRKTVDVGPSQGFVVETILLVPLALATAIWFWASGKMHFGVTASDTLLLLASGPVTAIPLLLFAAGARRLRYSTIGILQYITPTGMFVIAIFIFREPASFYKLVGFVFIWAALAVYTIDSLRQDHARKTVGKTL
jgi:chloramphenicol-sensitive protein RarD